MKLSVKVMTLVLVLVPAVPVLAVTSTPAAAATITVARYSFDATTAGKVPDLSGRGTPLTVRTADAGAVRFLTSGASRYIGLPVRCAAGAKTCPRALLEGTDDPDLDPGTRNFRWGASVNIAKTQLAGSSNVVQKGVATTESQWKMQVGETHGRAQCVVVGRGSAKTYLTRSSVAVADSTWHKIVCARSATSLSIWVDGVARGSTALPAGLSILNNKPLRIGGPNFNTTSDMFHGYIDDVYAMAG